MNIRRQSEESIERHMAKDNIEAKELETFVDKILKPVLDLQTQNNLKFEDLKIHMSSLQSSMYEVNTILEDVNRRLNEKLSEIKYINNKVDYYDIVNVVNKHLENMSRDIESIQRCTHPSSKIYGFTGPFDGPDTRICPLETICPTKPKTIQSVDETSLAGSKGTSGHLVTTCKTITKIQDKHTPCSPPEPSKSEVKKYHQKESDKGNKSKSCDLNPCAVDSKLSTLAVRSKVPQHRLEKSLKTIEDIWKEYEYGIKGNPPLHELEVKYGTKWRNESESRTFLRRKKIYEVIEHGKKIGLKDHEIIHDLERHRSYTINGSVRKRPLSWICKNLPQKYQS